jgi:uncharacterized membrane protein
MDSYELKRLAREQMKDKFWMVAVASLVIYAISTASIPFVIGLVLAGPLFVGYAYYLLDIAESRTSKGDRYELLFEGFKHNLSTPIVASIVASLFIFLYTLLLIIPGIIKALAYSMIPFIIAENPSIDPMDALKKSEEMMAGHKTRLFGIFLSFIGWYILCALTFGILLIYVIPYVQLTLTNFYIDLRGKKKIIIEA